jgi:glycerol uptake facilitator-like aquaporin
VTGALTRSQMAAFFNEFVATAIVSGSVLALGDDVGIPFAG